MVLYIGIYIESDWLYHAEWVALSNGQSGSELAEYSVDNTIIANTPEIAAYDKNYDGFFSFLKAAKKKSGITHMDIIKTAKTINLSSGAALTVTPNSDEGEDILKIPARIAPLFQ